VFKIIVTFIIGYHRQNIETWLTHFKSAVVCLR